MGSCGIPWFTQQKFKGRFLISTSAFLFCPVTSQHMHSCSTVPPHTSSTHPTL